MSDPEIWRAVPSLPGNRHTFDTHIFMKAFVAGLVLRNRSSVRPSSPSDRRGFAEVIRILEQRIDELEKGGEDRRAIREFVRIANDLRASNTGGYEGFESALRGLQLTFASCPNPFYEEISFSVPKPYAESTVNSLPNVQHKLVNDVAQAFVEAASEGCVAMDNNEEPIRASNEAAGQPSGAEPSRPVLGEENRAKIPFADMKPQQQAAIVGAKPSFWEFVEKTHGKVLRNDADARGFILKYCTPFPMITLISRNELETNHKARVIWHGLLEEYRAWRRQKELGNER